MHFFWLANTCFCRVRFSFFFIPSQQIGLGKRLRNDPFCVEWDVKPQLSQCSFVWDILILVFLRFLNFRKLKKHCEFDDWSRAVGRSTSSLADGHSVWSVTGQSVHSVHWVAVICDNVVNWPLGSALECRTFAPGASAAGGKCICWPGPILRNFSGCTISKVRVWCNALTLSKVRAS